jgi:putative flippase GtrA
MQKIWDIRFVRFLLVGALNTVFGYGLFVAFLYIGFHYSIAAFLSTVLGICFNFKTIGRLVFDSRDNRRIICFFGVYSLTFAFNLLGLRILSAAGIDAYTGGAILLLPAAVFGYALNKKFVFKHD